MSSITEWSIRSSSNNPALLHLCKITGESTPVKAIERMVDNLLYKYKSKYGNLGIPVNPWWLAELVDASVELAPISASSEGQLLPIQGGFIIRFKNQRGSGRANRL